MRFSSPACRPGCVVTPVAMLVALLAGCAGEVEDRRPAPVPSAPRATAGLETKPAPLPKLPKAAGPIDENPPSELTPTASGLYYRVLRKSEGKRPGPGDTVRAHYKGWLESGRQFDSSYDRGEPTEFPLSDVIEGWQEGLQLIGEGGMIELEVPARLGYGEDGFPPDIPPGATLHFLVELVEIR